MTCYLLPQIQTLIQKVNEMKGMKKRPNLKRVKKSADAMLAALTESSKLMKDRKSVV